MRDAVNSQLAQLKEAGVIAPVDSPTEWINNITTVWKPGQNLPGSWAETLTRLFVKTILICQLLMTSCQT